jgi:hypothetical protein
LLAWRKLIIKYGDVALFRLKPIGELARFAFTEVRPGMRERQTLTNPAHDLYVAGVREPSKFLKAIRDAPWRPDLVGTLVGGFDRGEDGAWPRQPGVE